MAKELPYFKFNPSKWMLGRISSENFRIQGIFMRACCIYWLEKNNKSSSTFTVNLVDFSKKLGKSHVTLLQNLGYIVSSDECINIPFLDEEFSEALDKHIVNSKNGHRGAIAKHKPGHSQAIARPWHLDTEAEKDTEADIYIQNGTLEENLIQLYSSKNWIDTVCKNESITILEFEKLFQYFKVKVSNTQEHKTVGALKGWFANWLPGNKEKILTGVEIPKDSNGQIDYSKVDYSK